MNMHQTCNEKKGSQKNSQTAVLDVTDIIPFSNIEQRIIIGGITALFSQIYMENISL